MPIVRKTRPNVGRPNQKARKVRRELPRKAIVLDMDGILALGDAAGEFFKNMDEDEGDPDAFWKIREFNNVIAAAGKDENREKTRQDYLRRIAQIHHALFPDSTKKERLDQTRLYFGSSLKTHLNHHVLRRQALGKPLTLADMEKIGKSLTLMPGAPELIERLKRHPALNDAHPQPGQKHDACRIYLNTAAFTPIAIQVAEKLGIPKENVFGTPVEADSHGKILGARQSVNILRFKRDSLRKIIRRARVTRQHMVGIGDSATDYDFLAAIAHPGKALRHRLDAEGKRILNEKDEPAWFNTAPRRGGVMIAHNPGSDMIEQMARGRVRAEYQDPVQVSLFLNQQYRGPPQAARNAVTASAMRIDQLWPLIRVALRSQTPRQQKEAIRRLVVQNRQRRRPNDPIFLYAHREIRPELFDQFARRREELRGEIAKRTRKD